MGQGEEGGEGESGYSHNMSEGDKDGGGGEGTENDSSEGEGGGEGESGDSHNMSEGEGDKGGGEMDEDDSSETHDPPHVPYVSNGLQKGHTNGTNSTSIDIFGSKFLGSYEKNESILFCPCRYELEFAVCAKWTYFVQENTWAYRLLRCLMM